MAQNPAFVGAAFSLASLDQASRNSLSCMNLNVNFDTGMFLKSGSFDCLNMLGSQFFKQDPNMAQQLTEVKPVTHTAPQAPLSHPVQQLPTSLPNPIPSTPQQVSNGTTSPINLKQIPSVHSNVLSVSNASSSPNQLMPYGNNALIVPRESEKRLIERKEDSSKFVDVTPFLTLPQHEAAKKLGIPSSTLAKRWKEASCNRKWPYRTVSKLDKEILTLLKNVENAKAELSPSVEANLGLLLKKRQEELKTVLVRL